jgi:hypothetical protein
LSYSWLYYSNKSNLDKNSRYQQVTNGNYWKYYYHLSILFLLIIVAELEIPLNKFEKQDLVIKLHNEWKTYSEIAHIAHVSLRDIKPILKKYERKLENKKRRKEISEIRFNY